MPDDHSNSVPPLPIPNRTVKRAYADDSAATSVKVGYRQASYSGKTPVSLSALKIALSANRGFFRLQKPVFSSAFYLSALLGWLVNSTMV